MRVYFSHPTLTYRTRTEEKCMGIIEEVLGPEEIINPANYGIKDDLRQIVRATGGVVGMAIGNKYTFLVWNEMEEGEKHGAKLYTIRVQDKEKIGGLEKGMPRDTVRLNREDSHEFTRKLLKENRSSLLGLLFGNWGSRF
ncbi:MAG: hypothetical protein ACLFN7_03235 [Candidatus Acetothermia bacterium]